MSDAKVELPVVGESCSTCRYWDDARRDGFPDDAITFAAEAMGLTVEETRGKLELAAAILAEGFCRRYPPQVTLVGDEYDSRQPSSEAGDWCGEWRPKAAGPKGVPPRDDVTDITEVLRQAGESGATPWQVKKSLGKKFGDSTREKRILCQLVAAGVAERIGRGTAGHPFKYRLAAQHGTPPAKASE